MEIFAYIQNSKVPSWLAVIMLAMAAIITLLSKWEQISKVFGKKHTTHKRSCGDCVMMIIGIREKFEYEARRLRSSILRAQMTFAEAQIHEAIYQLVRTFRKDLDELGAGKDQDSKNFELTMYRESLKNAINGCVKDEIRRSFKENGFLEMSEVEFSAYVKQKFGTILSMAREYLLQYYPENENTIVTMKYRFENMDEQRFESMVFQIFRNAKEVVIDAKDQEKGLLKEFHYSIDNLVNNKTAPDGKKIVVE